MAKRQARFTPREMEDDPRLQDHSPDLWSADSADSTNRADSADRTDSADSTDCGKSPEFGEVARGLLASAVRCFAGNGFHATTTRDISAGVGLSPAALYVHFPSKEAVLYEIMRIAHERALAHIQGPETGKASGAAERLRLIMTRYTAWHARHHVAARVCQYELNGLTPEHYDEIRVLRHQTNKVFRDAVARGVTDGTFTQVDVNRVVRGMLSLGIDLVRWYRLDGPDSPEELGEFYADLALRMVVRGAPDEPPRTRPAGQTDHATAQHPA